MGDVKLNKQEVKKYITSILNDLEIMKKGLITLQSTDFERFGSNYEMVSINTALTAERVTCDLRKLIYTTTNLTPAEYLEMSANELDIKISCKDGIYEIEVPTLLNKKGAEKYSDFIASPLAFSLSSFINENEINLSENLAVCFNQVYDKNSPTRRIRDYDNIDLKRILDLITIYFIPDDSGYYIDMFNTTSFGEKDMTKICIMDKKRFEEWLRNI